MGIEFVTPEGKLNPQLVERTGAPGKYGIHCLEVGALRISGIRFPSSSRDHRSAALEERSECGPAVVLEQDGGIVGTCHTQLTFSSCPRL